VAEPAPIDARRVRARFERCAPGYDASAAFAREVASRMLERLDLVRMQPACALDLGSGTGGLARALLQRYPQARIIALDFSLSMLRAGRPLRPFWAPWRAREPQLLCATMEHIPLADACCDMVCSNLAIEWSTAPELLLSEVRRILRRGGLFMFSTLGPDTLRELRAAATDAGPAHPLADMHDVGDALLREGFADPVMEVERLTLTYPNVHALLRELRASGCATRTAPRTRGLRGRAWLAEIERAYAAYERDARIPASFELVYGHAWKPEAPRNTADGRSVVHFTPRLRP